MTDLTALDELIKAVEAGEFQRGKGQPARYNDLLKAAQAASIKCSPAELIEALYHGDSACARFLRAQIGGAA